jgi:hypothetical protein
MHSPFAAKKKKALRRVGGMDPRGGTGPVGFTEACFFYLVFSSQLTVHSAMSTSWAKAQFTWCRIGRAEALPFRRIDDAIQSAVHGFIRQGLKPNSRGAGSAGLKPCPSEGFTMQFSPQFTVSSVMG